MGDHRQMSRSWLDVVEHCRSKRSSSCMVTLNRATSLHTPPRWLFSCPEQSRRSQPWSEIRDLCIEASRGLSMKRCTSSACTFNTSPLLAWHSRDICSKESLYRTAISRSPYFCPVSVQLASQAVSRSCCNRSQVSTESPGHSPWHNTSILTGGREED